MSAPPRIVTVTLNASIDYTAGIPNFTAGAVNRVAWEQADAGGKGVNVASFLADYGYAIAVTGFLGRDNQAHFLRLFAEKGLVDRFVRVPGRTRTNIKVVDDERRQVTDINFPGVTVESPAVAEVLGALDALADGGAEVFVLSGSLPAGVSPTIYREIITRLKARGRMVVVDSSGAALAHAIAAAPAMIKPNRDELAELVGHPLEDEPAIVAAACGLRAQGIDRVVVSMGERGAIFVNGDAAIHAAPPLSPPATVRSTVAAGDAMVAGTIHAVLQGLDVEACARLATAFALGALGEIGPRLPSRVVITAFAEHVTTRRVSD